MNLSFPTRLAILLFCAISGIFGQSAKPEHAKISLMSEHSSLAPGQPDWIGIRFDLDPDWHIYWTNPGDSGEPPRVTWQLPASVKAADLQFPTPQRIQDHSLTDYGYQGTVVLLSKFTVAPGVPKQAEIGAEVRYLVCREICVPGKAQVSLRLPEKFAATTSSAASEMADAQKKLPQSLPRGVLISAVSSENELNITVSNKDPSFGKIVDFIPADEQVIDNGAKPAISSGKDAVVIKLKKSEQLNHPVAHLRGLLITTNRAYNVVVPVTSGRPQTTAKRS